MRSIYHDLSVCLTLTAMAIAVHGSGQTFENIKAISEGDKIRITYDLKNLAADASVFVRVFSSHDSFGSALTRVTGDLQRVRGGTGKEIIFSPNGLLDNFSGVLSFILEGEIILDWKFLSARERTWRRGTPATIQWVGGFPDENVTLEVIDPNGHLASTAEIENNHTFRWQIPVRTKTGQGYVFRLRASGATVQSDPFRIKRRVPRFFMIAPIVLAGGTYVFLAKQEEPLPEAPGPPDSN